MRRSSVATVLVLTAGLAATAAVRRFVSRRRSVAAPLPVAAVPPVPADDAVVLPFARRTASAPAERPAPSLRCGDNGGRTKAGAPCAARATSAGRCHHHRVAA